MLRTLVKKQLMEIFRGYFTDRKKNTARSKGMTILLFVIFGVTVIGILGGMFWGMALSICMPLQQAGTMWLYFALMGLISIFLGVFGSVFSTYQGLYLSKDNDLLLSMPIPVRTILFARMVAVYLIGLLFTAVVSVPAVLVAWLTLPLRASAVIGGIVWILLLSTVVLILSCALGWVVARVSLRLKNKSIVTVLISLVCVGAYYFVYFRAQQALQVLIANAAVYGERIKSAAYGLYLFGRAGEGAGLPLIAVTAVVGALFALLCVLLSRSFLRVATATGAVVKTQYKEKTVPCRSVPRALLLRELTRFAASPLYMLNCGLGVVMLPLAGIALLWKGETFFTLIDDALGAFPGVVSAILIAALGMAGSMNDMAAPSVSLEGKTIWILQSLPVTAKQVLRSKLRAQLWISVPPMLFCAVCAAAVAPGSAPARVMLIVTALAVTVFLALFGLTMGLKMPNLSWTNEVTPIKQSGCVVFTLFGGWGYAALLGGLYLLVGYHLGLAQYLTAATALTAVLSALLYRWILHSGTKIFTEL